MKRHAFYAGCTLVLALAATSGSQPLRLKCPPGTPVMFPNAPEPAWVLNGKAADSTVMKSLKPDSVESIEIACADEVYRVFKVEARRNAVVIFTIPGPTVALKNALETVKALQQQYHERHGRYATTAEALGWSDASGLISVDIAVTENGTRWFATAKHRYRLRDSGITVSGTKE
jgi:hypothetical protein